MEDAVARAFVAEARRLLTEDYLPKIERCLELLREGDLWWRAGAESNSVGNLLLHLEGNARQWIVCGVVGAADERERQREFDAGRGREPGEAELPTARELFARLRGTVEEADGGLARLEPSVLLERRRIQGLREVEVLRAVFHVVEHFSMHTGQIILLTKMRAGRDLAFYDFSEGAPRANWRR
ncbi:MAG: DinB family protein [Pyrinomonadaceae bacterium]